MTIEVQVFWRIRPVLRISVIDCWFSGVHYFLKVQVVPVMLFLRTGFEVFLLRN